MIPEDTKITPMLQQYKKMKEAHPDKLLLFRMGDFYETFFDDAQTMSKILGITLTARNKSDGNPIPLAGFPYHAIDSYLDKLIKAGLKVAICEQVEDPKLAKGLVKREIVEIITPGVILDQQLIEGSRNNFFACIHLDNKLKIAGLAYLDISTGDFLFSEMEIQDVKNEIQRIHPAEIIIQNPEIKYFIDDLKLDYTPAITIYDSWYFDLKESTKLLKEHFHTTTLESLGAQGHNAGAIAAGAALAYVKSLRDDNLSHITSLHFYSLSSFMQLDEITRRNLELIRSMRYGNRSGSLIDVLDKTQTPMGSRLLHQWMMNPLLEQRHIEKRLDMVEDFLSQYPLTEDLRLILKEIGDLSRLLSKVGALRVNPRETMALGHYLSTAPAIHNLLKRYESSVLESISQDIPDFAPMIELIDKAISDTPPMTIMEGNIFKNEYNADLDELRSISRDGKSWIARLEAEERQKTGIPSLKIGYNKVFGYYLEVTLAHVSKIPDYYIRKQTLVNGERYISPQLKEYEAKVLGAEERIKSLEYELFKDIRNTIADYMGSMQKYVEKIAELDVLSTFAFHAYHKNYVRPVFTDSGILEMIDCRHPVIEQILLDEQYIPNDVNLDDECTKIAIITGPNMAGKSTYLRQIGLLVIMAQMGCYIPAKSAHLPIFDKVFTRVGASDNLAMGQSTFLVEMVETANILNSATPRSLILLDEIGRGTSTFDGLSLAWAIVEYIHKFKKAKTLFATHYHELTELENVLSGVKNYNIAIREWNEQMIFLRKIERGGVDQSYGIQVARLAGLPDKVIKRAKDILRNLEEHELSPQGLTAKIKKQLGQKNDQLSIFEVIVEKTEEKDKLLAEIKDLELDRVSPMEAWQKLKEIQDKIE